MPVLIFAGALAGVAGTLYASVQTYITPEAFNFDLSLLFFVAILVGGRGTVLGPALATVILTILPELSVDLAAWSTLIHAALLLGITLLVPGGIGEGLRMLTEPPLPQIGPSAFGRSRRVTMTALKRRRSRPVRSASVLAG